MLPNIMGNGVVIMLREIDAPIRVFGQALAGLRTAYKISNRNSLARSPAMADRLIWLNSGCAGNAGLLWSGQVGSWRRSGTQS